jgi:hypothetical protein
MKYIQGPCLKHCYNMIPQSVFILFIFVLLYIIYHNKYNIKYDNKKNIIHDQYIFDIIIYLLYYYLFLHIHYKIKYFYIFILYFYKIYHIYFINIFLLFIYSYNYLIPSIILFIILIILI